MAGASTVDECVRFVQEMLGVALRDNRLAGELSTTYVVAKIDITDRDGVFFIDVATADAWTGSSDDPCDATLRMTADTARALWYGELDVVEAIVDGTLRVEGNVGTMADLVVLSGRLFRSCAAGLHLDW